MRRKQHSLGQDEPGLGMREHREDLPRSIGGPQQVPGGAQQYGGRDPFRVEGGDVGDQVPFGEHGLAVRDPVDHALGRGLDLFR